MRRERWTRKPSRRTSETFTIGIPSCGINRVVPTNRCYGELGDVICPQCGPGGPNVVPLDTGYDHALHSPYSAVPGAQDHYWINIASYPTSVPAIAPAFVLPPPTGWLAPFPSSHWISARNVAASHPSTHVSNPAYTIFRKCFCLTPAYSNPTISFNARADDTLQVWFNSQANVLLPPQFGSFNGPARPSLPSNPAWFHAGRNCLYALVEDTYGGLMGFDLEGTIQANGLASQPAFGVNGTSACAGATTLSRISAESNEESQIVAAILKFAEERRLSRIR